MKMKKDELVRRELPQPKLGAALIGKEEEALVLDVLRRRELFRYYGMDPEHPPSMVATLERELAYLIDVKYALAVNSGTAALDVALSALGVGPGDEVILPVWSWRSCFTAVVKLGARPVLAEVNGSLNIDPDEIDRLASKRTKAVLVVHFQGVAAEIDRIVEAAHSRGIKVLEDVAESPGALYKGRRLGSFGDIAAFSFQYAKSMTCGEGGAVLTSDPILFERAIRLHDVGQVRDYHRSQIEPKLTTLCGSNCRMTELQGAVALAQLRKLDGLRERCRALSSHIIARIKDLPGLKLRPIADPEGDSGFEIYFWLQDEVTATRFMEAMGEWGVRATRITGTKCHYEFDYCQVDPSHHPLASPFREMASYPGPGYRKEDFPKTESIIRNFVAVPIGVLFSDEDADYIASVIARVHEELELN